MNQKKIAVVIPAYNHADFVGTSIASVLTQDWPDLELHILDDGSYDDTLAVAEQAVARASGRVRCSVEHQENQGSARTINTLIDHVDADYVAILNSDDLYMPGRLTAFARQAEGEGLFFGFSGINFIESGKTEDYDLFAEWYRSKCDHSAQLPTCGFALLTGNITITSSNFFLSRELFDLVGGFDPALTLTQDWDFSIKALRWTEPVILPDRLLTYRVHPNNTWRRLQSIRREQSEQVLANYALSIHKQGTNPLAPSPTNWPSFYPYFVRICATAFSAEPIGTVLPSELLSLPAEEQSQSLVEQDAIHRLLAATRRPKEVKLSSEECLAAAIAYWETVRTSRADRTVT